MKVSHSATVDVTRDITLGELKAELEAAGVPDDAKPTLDVYTGNQMDPSYSRIRFSWETSS